MDRVLERSHIAVASQHFLFSCLAVFCFVILTAAGALVRIPLPFTPVPLTLQTFVVLLAGAFLGKGKGALSQVIYIAFGVFGIPLFTNAGAGIAYLTGPTAGYIFGFVAAAFMVGLAMEKSSENLVLISISMLTGSLVVLLLGSLWLMFLFRIELSRALWLGMFPFLAGDALKVFCAAALYRGLIYTRKKYSKKN